MDRASVTFGAPHSSARIMDGFVIGTPQIGNDSGRSASAGVDRIGKPLSQHSAVAVACNAPEVTEEEVIRGQLWFDLPLDERTQFGNCFSRMLLKCLGDMEQEEQEVRK
jgi:hypothetical protein